MRRKDFLEFGKILTILSENYDKPLSQTGVRVYFDALKDITIDEFRAAAAVAISEHEWWPKPATIRKIVGKGPKSEREQKETRAIVTANNAHEAWAKALNHITEGKARYGGTGVDDIDHTIRLMGGWPRMAEVKTGEIAFREREFIDKYKTWSKVSMVDFIEGKQILDRLEYNPKMIN